MWRRGCTARRCSRPLDVTDEEVVHAPERDPRGRIVRRTVTAERNVRGIVVLPDGRIACAGQRDDAGTVASVIALVEPTGAVIDVRDVDLGGDDAIHDLELDHHGRLVALGSVDDVADPAITDFVIARFIVP